MEKPRVDKALGEGERQASSHCCVEEKAASLKMSKIGVVSTRKV